MRRPNGRVLNYGGLRLLLAQFPDAKASPRPGIAPGRERQIRRAGIKAPAGVPQLAALVGSGGKIAKPNQAVTCLLTSFVISNIETWDLPLKTAFRFASALMFRRFFES